MAAKNGTWLIAGIVVVAGVLIALSFTKDKSKGPDGVNIVAYQKSIKADHTQADMQDIMAAKPSSAIVEEPKVMYSKEAFAVQVFSFKDKARADIALKQLKDKGYPAYVMMSDLGPRGVFYRVRVGSFATDEEAKQNLESVSRDFKSGIIVSE